jgi:IclR family acetate operon transcriptional repressor
VITSPVNPAVDSRGGVLPDDRTGRVQSIDRAAALLRAVAQAGPDGAPVAVLAAATGLNRATAWRLLATLETMDFSSVIRPVGTCSGRE